MGSICNYKPVPVPITRITQIRLNISTALSHQSNFRSNKECNYYPLYLKYVLCTSAFSPVFRLCLTACRVYMLLLLGFSLINPPCELISPRKALHFVFLSRDTVTCSPDTTCRARVGWTNSAGLISALPPSSACDPYSMWYIQYALRLLPQCAFSVIPPEVWKERTAVGGDDVIWRECRWPN